MSTNVIALAAEKREQTGKGPARTLRRDGKVPAIIYGKGKEEVMVTLNAKEITLQYRKASFMSQLFDIAVGKETFRVIPRSVQLHPVTDAIEHADFVFLAKDAKIHVVVNIHLLNEDKCLGLKRGGILNIVRRDVELVCHPDHIPHAINLDISQLNIGDSVHINDIELPEGASPAINRNFTLLTVVGRGGKGEAEGEEKQAAAAAS